MPDLRGLPKVDSLAASAVLADFAAPVRIEAARTAIARARAALVGGKRPLDVASEARRIASSLTAARVAPVINASGVVLHTGLGRARLAEEAVSAMVLAASSHAAIEIDLGSGRRGDRQDSVRPLLCSLTGAEDALVVNNCASAVLLSLAALGKGAEVILSRGQMVEIGGSFRMPDIVRRSGCRLVEVGCTNKTRLSDYEEAITPRTKAILRCHPSNFRVEGFVEEPPVAALAELAHTHGLFLIDDVGSGCLVDTTAFGMAREAIFGESLQGGVDLAMASGDKLLGGPQAGLVIGSAKAVKAMARHPLARAVRVDKLTLAALAATLQLYQAGDLDRIPTLRYLKRPEDEVKAMAERLSGAYAGSVVQQGHTEVGGGSLPGEGVPTWRCGLPAKSADALAKKLRTGAPPIIGRIEKGVVWLDPRTMEADEIEAVCDRLRSQ